MFQKGRGGVLGVLGLEEKVKAMDKSRKVITNTSWETYVIYIIFYFSVG